ncbi:MAG TPA: PP2C family protein-serine/threonine phosphatase [Thermoanaerobaculia bacterium]
MARVKDWLDLADTTVRDLRTRDVADLYAIEWPETKKFLVADHLPQIEQERSRPRRFLRTWSAIFYGLAKRLVPQRRLLFVAAQLFALIAVVTFIADEGSFRDSFWILFGMIAAPALLSVVLGMELIDKIKFRDELELARDLQANLIPKILPNDPPFEIAAHNAIANTVGGDIYDFIILPNGRLAVLFGDASGHGMAAGLVMAVAHAAFRTQLELDPSPDAMFATLNRILCQTGGSRSFFAGVYLLVGPDGAFETKVAGHPPILHVNSKGNIVDEIGKGAYPLGIKRTLDWPLERRRMSDGDLLVLHSDGLVEARNALDVELGEPAVHNILRAYEGKPAGTLIDALVGEYKSFCGRRLPDDDISIAAIRFSRS